MQNLMRFSAWNTKTDIAIIDDNNVNPIATEWYCANIDAKAVALNNASIYFDAIESPVQKLNRFSQ